MGRGTVATHGSAQPGAGGVGGGVGPAGAATCQARAGGGGELAEPSRVGPGERGGDGSSVLRMVVKYPLVTVTVVVTVAVGVGG